MNKRNALLLATACLLALALVWVFIPVRVPKTDEARFERWQRTSQILRRVDRWRWQLPPSLDHMLHLPALEKRYFDEHTALRERLIASGCLTNAVIQVAATPTNDVQRARFAARMRGVIQNRGGFNFGVIGTNAVAILCRPQEVDLFRQALQADPGAGHQEGLHK